MAGRMPLPDTWEVRELQRKLKEAQDRVVELERFYAHFIDKHQDSIQDCCPHVDFTVGDADAYREDEL